MRSVDQIVAGLPADRRAKVVARINKLVGEEIALRHLRQARDFTQQNMAVILETDQASISKIEKRSDMLLSTLRSYVEAMGGSLRLTAEFPDGCVDLTTFGEVAGHAGSTKKARSKKTQAP